MSNSVWSAAKFALVCISMLFVVGCGKDSRVQGTSPNSVDGRWLLQTATFDCAVVAGVLTSPETIRLLSGDSDEAFLGVSASGQFIDSSENEVSFAGRYYQGSLTGELTIRTPEGRVVVLSMSLEWSAQAGADGQGVAGFVGSIEVVSDTAGECTGASASVSLVPTAGSSDPEEVFEECGPVDIVFAMDTSGSMDDEGRALCAQIDSVLARLNDLGLTDVRVFKWGITEDADDEPEDFPCLTDNVKDVFNNPEVPGMPGRFLNLNDSDEDWGPATAIVSELGASGGFSFQWRAGALRIFVPLSDEGPSNGDPSDDPDDAAVIANAITVAKRNRVIVSPIIGSGAEPFVSEHARNLADGTGGVAVRSSDPDLDLAELIFDIVFLSCGGVPLPPEPPIDPGATILIAITKSGDIHAIDTGTAALSIVGSAFISEPSDGLLSVSSMFYNENSNQLWAGTGGQADCNACVFEITGDLTARLMADNDDEAFAHPGLAQRRSDGLILGFPGEDDSDLLVLNQQTGVAAEYAEELSDIVALDFEGMGITFVGARCYAAIHESLVEIDAFSGLPGTPRAITLVGFPTGEVAIEHFHINSMTTRPSDGKVFCIVNDRTERKFPEGSSSTFLATMDVSTGRVTNIGNLALRMDGLTWIPADYFTRS